MGGGVSLPVRFSRPYTSHSPIFAGPKDKVPAETAAAWRQFPRSCDWYGKTLTRIADICASVGVEQAVVEILLQWLPPAMGAIQPGMANLTSSQFDFDKFTKRLKCVSGSLDMGGMDSKELAAKQKLEGRNLEAVGVVVCVAACDVFAALLHPRPERLGSPIDPDIGHIIVRLAFGQFNPGLSSSLNQLVHGQVALVLHQRNVLSWSHVVCHLARARFDQVEIGRAHV